MNLQLKTLRKRKGYTQSSLAAAIGLSARRVSAYERQETPMPLDVAAQIADVLECSLDQLAGRQWFEEPYLDPVQRNLNLCFENMNREGQQTLARVARSMEKDAVNRIEKEGQNIDSKIAASA